MDGKDIVELFRLWSESTQRTGEVMERLEQARQKFVEVLNLPADDPLRGNNDFMYQHIKLQHETILEFIKRAESFSAAVEAATEGHQHELREIRSQFS